MTADLFGPIQTVTDRSLRKACMAVKEKHEHEKNYKYPEECTNIVDQRAGSSASALRWNDYYDGYSKKYLIPFKMDSSDGNFRHLLQLRIIKINDIWQKNRVPLELVFWTEQDAQERALRTAKTLTIKFQL